MTPRIRSRATLIVALTLALAGAASGPVSAGPCVPASPVNDRCDAWAAVYDDPAAYATGGEDFGTRVVAGNGLVYTTVASESPAGWDIVVMAYRQDTGATAWTRRWDVDYGFDDAWALALSGSTLAVAGESSGDLLLLALDASTGEVRWSDLRDGPQGFSDVALAVTPSPDGSTLFAAGRRDREPGNSASGDAWLVAYDVLTGEAMWEASYAGPAGADLAEDVDVAPDGGRVYLTMTSAGAGTGSDVAVAAFEAADEERLGELLWERRIHGGSGAEDALESVLSADGGRLFVAVTSQGPGAGGLLMPTNYDILTVALHTADGGEAWSKRVGGEDQVWDYAQGIALAGDRVVVAGSISSRVAGSDVVVLAYEAATGVEAWRSVPVGPPLIADLPADIVPAPGGDRVYVTWTSKVPRASGGVQGVGLTTNHGTIITASYAVDDGDALWTARHSSAAETSIDTAAAVAVAPDGSRVFVTGSYGHRPFPSGNLNDAVTLAYAA